MHGRAPAVVLPHPRSAVEGALCEFQSTPVCAAPVPRFARGARRMVPRRPRCPRSPSLRRLGWATWRGGNGGGGGRDGD